MLRMDLQRGGTKDCFGRGGIELLGFGCLCFFVAERGELGISIGEVCSCFVLGLFAMKLFFLL